MNMIEPQTLRTLGHLSFILCMLCSFTVDAYQPTREMAQDDQFTVARTLLNNHQKELLELIAYARQESSISKAYVSPQGDLKAYAAADDNAAPIDIPEALASKLRKLLQEAKVQAFKKQGQQVYIPFSTSEAGGNTLFSSIIYSPEKIELNDEDCVSAKGFKSFLICIWPIQDNWYMHFDWSYFKKPKGAMVKPET